MPARVKLPYLISASENSAGLVHVQAMIIACEELLKVSGLDHISSGLWGTRSAHMTVGGTWVHWLVITCARTLVTNCIPTITRTSRSKHLEA